MSIPACTGSHEPADVVNPITAKIAFITDLLSQQIIDNNAELHLGTRPGSQSKLTTGLNDREEI